MTALKITIASTKRPTMRLVSRPIQDSQREIDVAHRLTAAIAEELWRLFGGNEQLNWVEAELHLKRLVESLRGQVNGEAIEKARAQALDEARRESDLARERLFLMLTRMDGGGDTGAPFEARPAADRQGVGRGPSPGIRTKPQRGSEVSKVPRHGSLRREKVGAA